MNQKNNYQKFKKHLKSGGLVYALLRGIKYFLFLIKKDKYKNWSRKRGIHCGKTDIICTDCGIDIYWNGRQLTRGIGLNTSIYSLGRCFGRWTDSTKAKWRIIEKTETSFILKNTWRHLPIIQTWKVELKNQNLISWEVELEIKKPLCLKEKRATALLSEGYKRWFNSWEEGKFPTIKKQWQTIDLNHLASRCVGLRSVTDIGFLPAIMFNFSQNDFEASPLIQNAPHKINARCLGVNIINEERLLPGKHKFLSAEIKLFEQEELLDRQIEALRQEILKDFKIPLPFKKEKNFKVALVNLPWQRNGKWGVRAGSRWPHIKEESEKDYLPFPFFLAYATSLLRKNDIEAYLIDAIAEEFPEQRFLERIDRMDIDLLVAEISTPSLKNDLEILKKIGNKDFSIALCGPDVNIRSLEFLRNHNFIDFVLVGEYEFPLLNLAQLLSKGKDLKDIPGLIYRNRGEIKANSLNSNSLCDLDSLPWPERDGLPMEKYLDAPGGMLLPSVQMLASRGCPFKCSFCLWPQVMYLGNTYRQRDIADTINEMEFLVKERGFRSIYFDDDTFNVGKERMLRLSQEIKKRNLHNEAPWAVMARPDLMDEDILTEMKSAGLWAVKYGIESSNDTSIKSCHKNLNLEKASKMIKLTRDLGIKTHLTFCFGFPGDTKEIIKKTIDYALSQEPDSVQFSILTPFPGTRLFEELDKQGRILTRDWSKYDGHYNCVFKPDNLSPRDLIKTKKRAYQIWGYFKKERNLGENVKKFSAFLLEKGPIYTFKKTITFFYRPFIIEKLFIALRIKLFKNKITLIYKKIKSIGLIFAFNKLKDNYLDVAGIFSKRFAFKGPKLVQIDLTNKCNSSCIACWCNSPLLERKRNDGQTLPYEKVIEVIDRLKKKGTKEIYLAGGGEPLMHPRFLEIVQYIKKQRLICYINTNATLIDEVAISELVKLKVDYIVVSLWAGSPSVYKITHPNSKGEMTFYRIEQMLKLLSQLKKGLPRVYINNVIFNLNWQDLENMIDFALEVKAEGINFAVVDVIPGLTDKLVLSQAQRSAVLKTLKRAIKERELRKKFDLWGIDTFMKRLSNTFSNEGKYDKGLIDDVPCYSGWSFSRILANGDVNPCLKAHRVPVGNIFRDDFWDIWNSPRQQDFRINTCVCEKRGEYFRLIGNDIEIKEAGCYKGCDDIERSIALYKKINSLTSLEKSILRLISRALTKFC